MLDNVFNSQKNFKSYNIKKKEKKVVLRSSEASESSNK